MRVAIVGNDLRAVSLSRALTREGNDVVILPGPLGGSVPPSVRCIPLPRAEGPSWWQMRRRGDIVTALRAMSVDMIVFLHVESADAEVVDALRVETSKKGRASPLLFGVDHAGSQLEVSKSVGLSVAREAGLRVPTSTIIPAGNRIIALPQLTVPFVLKADGLAGGRGTVIVNDAAAIWPALARMPDGDVVLQEFIEGTEVALSLMICPLGIELLDVNFEYKREHEGDGGENTPGMGTVACGARGLEVALKLLGGLPERLHAIGYCGPLDVNFMITSDNRPVFLEFTCRFGDPELCSELLLLADATTLLANNARGRLGVRTQHDAIWSAGVVARGQQLPKALENIDSSVDYIITDGAVELCATGSGDSLEVALTSAYTPLTRQRHLRYRRDIGHDCWARLSRLKELLDDSAAGWSD